jgi:simple sugar transport system substrate-binding protein
MKKLLALVVIMVMMLSVVACSTEEAGKKGGSSTSSGNGDLLDPANYKSDKEKSEWTIGVVTKDNTAAWFKRMEVGVNKYGKKMNINVIQKGPANADAASQVQVIDDLIAQGVDALCVVPIDPGAIEASLENALSKGIVVVTHEASNQKNTLFDVEAFTSEGFGAKIMDSLASAMGEVGKYAVMVGYTTSTTHMEYANAQKARQVEAYPKMELINNGEVPSAESEESVDVAYKKAKEILKAFPDLKGFTGVASTDSPGIANAVEELGLSGKVSIVGVGTPNEFSDYVKAGTISKLLLWDPADAGYAMVSVAAKILAGEEITEGVDLGVTGYDSVKIIKGANKTLIGNAPLEITKENIDDYDF